MNFHRSMEEFSQGTDEGQRKREREKEIIEREREEKILERERERESLEEVD